MEQIRNAKERLEKNKTLRKKLKREKDDLKYQNDSDQ